MKKIRRTIFLPSIVALCVSMILSLPVFASGQVNSASCFFIKPIVLKTPYSLTALTLKYGLGTTWIPRFKALNPYIKNWDQLAPGTKIRAPIPLTAATPAQVRAELNGTRPPMKGFVEDGDRLIPCLVKVEKYVVEENETLSSILYKFGVGAEQSKFRLYGKFGWLAHNLAINESITGWADLKKGTEIIIRYPVLLRDSDNLEAGTTTALNPLEVRVPAVPLFARGSYQSYADPIFEKTNRRQRKVSKEVSKKAWDMSILDAMTGESEGVVDGMSAQVASGYFGIRYGHALASSEELLTPKIQSLGLITELRSGWFDGLRLMVDLFPEVKDSLDGNEAYFSLQRLLIGWAFEFEFPWFFDFVHVTPRVGSYSLKTRLPIRENLIGQPIFDEVEVANALGAGIELDLERATFWYILRGWVSTDLPSSQTTGGRENATSSTRGGVDAFLKGQGFTKGTSLAYLAFFSYENIGVSGKGEEQEFDLELAINQLGLGLTISW